MNRNVLSKTLTFAAVVEVGTGLVLLIDPATVVELLLGAEVSGVAAVIARCFGISLLALGMACWPVRQSARSDSPAFCAMLVYNALIALYLTGLRAAQHWGGMLLWPAVVVHVAVALLLLWVWRDERGGAETDE